MFLELCAIFIGSMTVAFSGALIPGPLFTVAVADSARRGFITGPLLILGHAILELALVIAIILGMGPILKNGWVMALTALLGGGILVWMGAGMLRTAAELSLHTDSKKQSAHAHPVLTGILASLSNPYWILWWATLGLGLMAKALKLGTPGLAAFFIGHISADFLWYSMISFSVSRGKRIMTDGAYRLVIRICGVILLGFGAWFLVSSGTLLRKVI